MLVTMKQILDRACAEGYAVGAPNVGNQNQVEAAIDAAEEMKSPLILDVHLDNIGPSKIAYPREFAWWMRQRCILAKVPIAINEDHGRSFATAMRNIQAGVTSVMADRSALPFEENVAEVKKIVEAAHAVGISTEAELGHVGKAATFTGGALSADSVYTKVEEAVSFVQQTGVDCLAISIGTAHGKYPDGFEPHLDLDRLAAIKKALDAAMGRPFPLVLHGSSGTPIDQQRKACRMGINKVNVATDLLIAEKDAVAAAFTKKEPFNFYDVAKAGFGGKLKSLIPVYGSDGKAWIE